jgi:hypothetical protein
VQGFSLDFAAAINEPHIAIVIAELSLNNGSPTRQLEVHAGSVLADRLAAQTRTIQIELIDRDGTLTPTGMTSELAPFGSRITLRRGIRIPNEVTVSRLCDISNSWLPATPIGQMACVKIDPVDGGLTLGP